MDIKAKFEVPAAQIGTILAEHFSRTLGVFGKDTVADFKLEWEIATYKNGDKIEAILKGVTIEFVEKRVAAPAPILPARPEKEINEPSSTPATSGA